MQDSTNRSSDYRRGRQDGRQQGAYGALTTARRALRATSALEVARILNGLVSADDLGAVLRQLEQAADLAEQS